MKQFENIFRTLFTSFLGLLIGLATPAYAQDGIDYEQVDISLITCTPHEEVYSLYGHSAIRYHDRRTGLDAVFNYGVFNYAKPHFVLRFMFGLTDYELGIAPARGFCRYYDAWGSEVSEQVLNLTVDEKRRIKEALEKNALPQNRVYRYNFFYDNCATRPRDIIEQNVNGRIVYEERPDYTPSYREMIHKLTGDHRWAAFGNDLLLGFKADQPTTQRQQHFLPHNLAYDFGHATIVSDSSSRPLVLTKRVLVPAKQQEPMAGFPLSPKLTFILFLMVPCFIVWIWEIRHKRLTRTYDVVLMLLTGLAGVILTAMLFSQHPATSSNLQVLILNPLSLLYIYKVARGRRTPWFKICGACMVLCMIGSFFQDYAEGMEIVAFCLLFRCLVHIRHDK